MRRHRALHLALSVALAAGLGASTGAGEPAPVRLRVRQSEWAGDVAGAPPVAVTAEADGFRVEAPLALEGPGEAAVFVDVEVEVPEGGAWSAAVLTLETELAGAGSRVSAFAEHWVGSGPAPNVPPPNACRLSPELPICRRETLEGHYVVSARAQASLGHERAGVRVTLPGGGRSVRVRLSLVVSVAEEGGHARLVGFRERFLQSSR